MTMFVFCEGSMTFLFVTKMVLLFIYILTEIRCIHRTTFMVGKRPYLLQKYCLELVYNERNMYQI